MSTGDMHNFGSGAEPTKSCPYCGEHVKIDAKKCKHCGEIIDVVMRDLQAMKEAKNSGGGGPNIVVTATGGGGGGASSSSSASAAAAAGPAGPVVALKPEGSILVLLLLNFIFPVVPSLIYYSMRRWPWQS